MTHFRDYLVPNAQRVRLPYGHPATVYVGVLYAHTGGAVPVWTCGHQHPLGSKALDCARQALACDAGSLMAETLQTLVDMHKTRG